MDEDGGSETDWYGGEVTCRQSNRKQRNSSCRRWGWADSRCGERRNVRTILHCSSDRLNMAEKQWLMSFTMSGRVWEACMQQLVVLNVALLVLLQSAAAFSQSFTEKAKKDS